MNRRMAVLVAGILLAACSHGMDSFSLPPNVSVAVPDPRTPHDEAALAGAWEGTWLTPGWGPGYEGLLVVEHLDGDQATVLYAWGHHQSSTDSGWYRQRARLLPGGKLEWTRGKATFSFSLDADRRSLAGVFRDDSPEPSYVTMEKVPFQAPKRVENPTPKRPLTLPAVPTLNIIPASKGLPPAFSRFLGTWEGTWDSGVKSRLVVWGINRATAMVVYAWSDDPAGGFKADMMKRVALVDPNGEKITWGVEPEFTFRLTKNGTSLEGEWEKAGAVSSVLMTKVKQ